MAKDAKKTQKKNSLNEKKKKEVIKKEENKKEIKIEEKEVIVKPKKEKKKFDTAKFDAFLKKIDDNRWPIILFIVGFLLATLIFRCIFWPDRIATLKDGTQPIATLKGKTITADDLYTDMKKYYSVNVFLNKVDDLILTEKYPTNDEMTNEIKSTAENYYTAYEKNYNMTKEAFLSQYGFSSEQDFLDNLMLDYRKNKYYEDYAISLVTDNEIEKYYDKEVFGDVDSKHILVSIKGDDDEDGLSDEEAKKLTKEIIAELDKGTSWDDVVKKYKDQIITEDLGYNAFNASLESAYLKECKDLKVNTYSKSPVLTSYGYHIVYKKAQKDKPKLKDVKDDIIDILAKEKKDSDSNLYYKALINMRTEAELEFTDTKLKEEYQKYTNQYK